MTRTRTKHGVVNLRHFGDRPIGLVALHGFTQNGGSFEELASYLDVGVVAIDLPGHGSSEIHPITFEVAVEVIGSVLESFSSPMAVLGYSQGGRIALGLAVTRPEPVDRVVLVSASPGIGDPERREERRLSDEALADRIEKIGLPAFIDGWLGAGMFEGLRRRPEDWRSLARSLRLENTPAGLAAALRGMGQGAQPYLGRRLKDSPTPALLVVGERDAKYRSIAASMSYDLPHSIIEVISEAGHSVIGEQPEAVAHLVNGFIAPSAGC